MNTRPLEVAGPATTDEPRAASARARRGALILNLGTPDRPDTPSVRRYLREFLSDPDVIQLPPRMRWMNKPLASMIALFRASQSAEAYRSIWTEEGSPLKVITEQQVSALEEDLPGGWRVFYAMRYGRPSVAEALRSIVDAGVEDLVVLPMYPQYSGPTTGTAVDDLYQHLRTLGRRLQVTVRGAWHDDVGYVDAQARLIHDLVVRENLQPRDCVLVFSAHSMPESYIRAGDPYQEQILRSVDLIVDRLGWPRDRMRVAYQSKLGPVPWLSPSTEQTILDLAAAGEPNAIVCPVSFTADCLETIEEIGIRYREPFEAAGGRLHLCPALNTYPPFIATLSRLVLRGVRRAPAGGTGEAPLIESAPVIDDAWVDRLVMVGAALPARLENGVPRPMEHLSLEEFRRVKRPQEEVPQLLRSICDTSEMDECWLWNTCSRFELYGWVPGDNGIKAADRPLDRAISAVGGTGSDSARLNVLRGRDALHHLLRTAAGLNSGLPGDGEIVGQLEVAHELATRTETAGPCTALLREEVRSCIEHLAEHTPWGGFRPEYCTVALKRVALDLDVDWPNARIVVVGGSITALSTVNVFRDHLGVPVRNMTVAYRNHRRGTLMKRLRAACREGTRLRLDTYSDARLQRAMAEADVIVFAIDSRSPIVRREQLDAARDLSERPLTIIDFNTFGSTDGAEGLGGVRLVDAHGLEAAVTEFSDSMLECPAFLHAAKQAERAIRDHVGRLASSDGDGCDGCDGCGTDVEGQGALPALCPGCPRRHELQTCPRRLMTERIPA